MHISNQILHHHISSALKTTQTNSTPTNTSLNFLLRLFVLLVYKLILVY